jgi:uncharacterized membrane protein YczE
LNTIFKPINWKTFPRDFVVVEIGLGLYGFAIAMLIHAGLGTSTWAVFEVAAAKLLGITVGTMIVIDGIWVFALVLLVKEKVGWGTLANILSIGPWTDLFNSLLPNIAGGWADSLWLRLIFFVVAILGMGFASAIYIGAEAGAGPRDSLMLAIHRLSGWSVRTSRILIDVTIGTAGILLGGPFGLGTIAFAFLAGPSVQFAFKVMKVKPHQKDEVSAETDV